MKIIWNAKEKDLKKTYFTPGGLKYPYLHNEVGEITSVRLQMVFEHQDTIYCLVLDGTTNIPYLNKYPMKVSEARFAWNIIDLIYPDKLEEVSEEEYIELQKAIAELGLII